MSPPILTRPHSPGHKYRFPWRPGNRCELLIDGPQFFPAMLAEIARARHSVWLEIYLFESGLVADRFIAALTDAAKRGVDVRLVLDDLGAYRLATADRERLRSHGIGLVFYNRLRYKKLLRNIFRDHRKLLVIDGRVVFTGGAGITDDFDPPSPQRRWRETMMRIEGPVVRDWQALFVDVWNEHRPETELLQLKPPDAAEYVDGMRGRVTATSGVVVQEIKRSLIRQIRSANRRVWISTAYFIPSRRMRRALRHAAHRGIDVRLLLPGPHTDHPAVRHAGRRFYARLLHSGVRIFEYQARFLHSKVMLCDDWVTLGSSNFDRWTVHWNLEANQEIDDVRFAQTVTAMLENDFAQSIECEYETMLRRPWYVQLRERWLARIDLWLMRLQMLARGTHPPGAFRANKRTKPD